MGLNISHGAIITKVIENSIADYAGFKRRDIIVQFNNIEIKSNLQLIKLIYSSKIGKTVNVKLIRNNKRIDMDIRIVSGEDKVVMDYTTGLMGSLKYHPKWISFAHTRMRKMK